MIKNETSAGSWKPGAVPEWLLAREKSTASQWRKKKRAEVEALRRAFDRYLEGCAYCPVSYREIAMLETKLDALVKAHTPKHWKVRGR